MTLSDKNASGKTHGTEAASESSVSQRQVALLLRGSVSYARELDWAAEHPGPFAQAGRPWQPCQPELE